MLLKDYTTEREKAKEQGGGAFEAELKPAINPRVFVSGSLC